MTRTISLITVVVGTALLLAVPAMGQNQQSDAFERTVAAQAQPAGVTFADAFERAAAAGQTTTAAFPPDAFERASVSSSSLVGAVSPSDHNARMGPVVGSETVSISSSGRSIEWPQIGIGIGFGLLLALGLVLAARVARVRTPAH
ncbi:MAG TPA: hypothetical protein VK926_02615 [Gaiellaceae bacterium]|nr:hypothetical protein [Gaiellaceae bacterium]